MNEVKLFLAVALGSKKKADTFFRPPSKPSKKCKAPTLAAQFPKEFHAYRAAKARCIRPNHPSWRDYGGRGIRMRFGSFEEFLSAIGPCPDGLRLDRWPRRNGDYRKGNVRWATPSEQARNRRPKINPAIAEWMGA
jgi:hypothetical protein